MNVLYAFVDIYDAVREYNVTVTAGDRLLGDANLDGEVDITDATTIQRYDARLIDLFGIALVLADVDRDNEVCIIDATWIQRYDADMKAPEGIGKPIDIS